MTHEIAFLDVIDAKMQAEIRSQLPPGFAIQFGETGDRGEHMRMVADADFILTAVAVDAEMIRSAPKLKLLHKWGIGVDKFDLDAARAARVPVAITAGANAGPVSEHTVMLMLATYRRLAQCDRKLREGQWIRPQIRGLAYQLSGKTVGLLGFGNVGRMVAHRLAGFDVTVIYYDIRRADRATEKSLRATPVTLEELLERSDVVSLHVPLTKVTRGIIGAETLSRMKPGAILINAARGEVVDEPAVYRCAGQRPVARRRARRVRQGTGRPGQSAVQARPGGGDAAHCRQRHRPGRRHRAPRLRQHAGGTERRTAVAQ